MRKPIPDRYKRLVRLKRFTEVQDMMRASRPIKSISKFIQEDLEELRDLNPTYLEIILRRYIKEEIKPLDIVENVAPAILDNAMERVENSINWIEEMTYLIVENRRRIEESAEIEKLLPSKILPARTEVMKLQKDILSDLSKRMVEIGILERQFKADTDGVAVPGEDLSIQEDSIASIIEATKAVKAHLSEVINEREEDDDEEDDAEYSVEPPGDSGQ